MVDTSEKERLDRARKRIAEIKGFYTHLTVYLIINTAITLMKIIGNAYYGEYFMGPFLHFSTLATWLFWGIGLFLHGVKVFSVKTIFSKEWEERQLKKIMDKDKRDKEKFS
ncbi:2TM domain-containing protein [Maribacter sp. CXY002]|uniref:2TM domain-containing protein n=1 Tax=Maribacter luteocoastalis TaxID=3407671 RepID=UPI003B66F5B3